MATPLRSQPWTACTTKTATHAAVISSVVGGVAPSTSARRPCRASPPEELIVPQWGTGAARVVAVERG